MFVVWWLKQVLQEGRTENKVINVQKEDSQEQSEKYDEIKTISLAPIPATKQRMRLMNHPTLKMLFCKECGKISMRLGTYIIAKKRYRKGRKKIESSNTTTSVSFYTDVTKSSVSPSLAKHRCNEPNLVTGGTDAIVQNMVGTDFWLLNKKSNPHSQGKNNKKNHIKFALKENIPPLTSQRDDVMEI